MKLLIYYTTYIINIIKKFLFKKYKYNNNIFPHDTKYYLIEYYLRKKYNGHKVDFYYNRMCGYYVYSIIKDIKYEYYIRVMRQLKIDKFKNKETKNIFHDEIEELIENLYDRFKKISKEYKIKIIAYDHNININEHNINYKINFFVK